MLFVVVFVVCWLLFFLVVIGVVCCCVGCVVECSDVFLVVLQIVFVGWFGQVVVGQYDLVVVVFFGLVYGGVGVGY